MANAGDLDKLHVYDIHTSHNLTPSEYLRLSKDVVAKIGDNGEQVFDLINRPSIGPAEVNDSLPLTDYFVSSSHNTYLLCRQIVGRSSSAAYFHVLGRGCRCVEMDVWLSSSGLMVNHGHTFSRGVPFAEACQAIREGLRECGNDALPVLVSLECHVGPEGQDQLVNTMVNVWGDRLVKEFVNGQSQSTEVTPGMLKGKIILMIEYYPTILDGAIGAVTANDSSSSSSSSDEEESSVVPEEKEGKRAWIRRKATGDSIKSVASSVLKRKGTQDSTASVDSQSSSVGQKARAQGQKISDQLAALGCYCRSLKPGKDWFLQRFSDPANVLINISETHCLRIIPDSLDHLIDHATSHLRRIFPKGTRISSSNFNPLIFWRNGSQVTSLNWQVFDRGMQVNEAMFVGSPGWVAKPEWMRKGFLGEKPTGKERLSVEIFGVSSLPAPNGRSGKLFKTYVYAQLFHSNGDLSWRSQSIPVQHVEGQGADATFNARFDWEYAKDELAFIRLICYEDEIGKDDKIAVLCARLNRLVTDQWLLIRLLDLGGKACGASMLAKFSISSIE